MPKLNIQGPYEKAVVAAKQELERLERRKEVLQRTIDNLMLLSKPEHYDLTIPDGHTPQALTEEIRVIIRPELVPLRPTDIRDALLSRGFSPTNQRNFLIAVHTILGRIKDEEEFEEVELPDGGKGYISAVNRKRIKL